MVCNVCIVEVEPSPFFLVCSDSQLVEVEEVSKALSKSVGGLGVRDSVGPLGVMKCRLWGSGAARSCSAVPCRAVQCSAVMCSAVPGCDQHSDWSPPQGAPDPPVSRITAAWNWHRPGLAKCLARGLPMPQLGKNSNLAVTTK